MKYSKVKRKNFIEIHCINDEILASGKVKVKTNHCIIGWGQEDLEKGGRKVDFPLKNEVIYLSYNSLKVTILFTLFLSTNLVNICFIKL